VSRLLSVEQARVWFGGVRAVDGATLELEQGKLHGLVGPNGSGKTTLVNAISGITRLTGGSIRFGDRDVGALSAHAVRRAGIARTFQAIRLLPTLTVRENVMLGGDWLIGPDRSGAADGWWGRRRGARRAVSRQADAVLERVGLGSAARQYPASLPYGTQRRVEIARAIVGEPQLLLLDEPVAGMNRHEREEIAALLTELRESGLTQLVIEHDLRTLLQVCDTLFVMHFGRCVAGGDPHETAALPEVQEAYLGKHRVLD
jgi:branched-chain amino acid transport system ATP-binding protein